MRVLGIVGSPRRERGRTVQLVNAALEGAKAAGAETELIYLIDYDLEACIHCGAPCFQDQICRQQDQATELSAFVDSWDGVVFGVPVYTWRPSALSAIFMDKLRLKANHLIAGQRNGRPALGIAMAGGTGSGCMGALQSLYRFFCLWAYRGIDPTPVTRYNFNEALISCRASGEKMTQLIANPRPFAGIADTLLHYDGLSYLHSTYVDEFLWMARQIARHLPPEAKGADVDTMRSELAQAEQLLVSGNRRGVAEHATNAFVAGRQAWNQSVVWKP